MITTNFRRRFLAPVALGGASAIAACSTSPPEPERVETNASAIRASGSAGSNATPPGAIWSVDFTTLPAGNAHVLASVAPQLALFRASAATVQTSPTTVDTTPSQDEARIGNTGTVSGLVIEEARTNFFTNSRNPGIVGWTATGYSQNQPGTTVTAAYAAGPDGASSGSRIQIPILTSGTSAIAQWFDGPPETPFSPSTTVTFSEWLRPTNAATGSSDPIVQWGVCDNDYHSNWAVSLPGYNGAYLQTKGTQWMRSILQPLPASTNALALAPGFQDWGWCGDLWAGVNSNVYAVDQVVDLIQAEPGFFATEPIVTDSSVATRAGDHLQITNGAAAVDGGQLSLYLKMYPKGTALACPTEVTGNGTLVTTCAPGYTAPAYLFYIDSDNYAVFNAQNQSVTLAVAGATASSAASTANASVRGTLVGSAPISIFSAGQSLEWFIRAGGGAGLVQYRVNGGPVATLLSAPLSGAIAPAAGIDLLSAGTANQFSSWLADVTVYRKGQGGLQAQSACALSPSGNGSITFTTTGGGLGLSTTSGQGSSAGSTATSWTITRGGATVLSGSTTRSAQGATTTRTRYGSGFHGLTQSITSFDGTTVTGSVNGRALVPESIAPTDGGVVPDGGFPAFADGKPEPDVQVDPNLQGEVAALLGHVRYDAMSLCPSSASPAIASLVSVLGAASSGVVGH